MLTIKNVTAKNFMSIGNNTQAVNFDTEQLTLVLGHNLDLGGDGSRNGTGKTTIINALSYALYGEALTNIRRDNLINKTNAKGMIVTVDFDINGKEYRIERGRRPNTLKFYIDGVEKADDEQQGDSRETQKEIERIIGFPHNMFKHLIALNTYTEPFLSMKTNDQRDMIEQLLGITEISEKAELLKEKLKRTKDSIKEEELRIQAVQNANKRIEKNIDDIELRRKAWDNQHGNKLAELRQSLDALSHIDIEPELEKHRQLDVVHKQYSTMQGLQNELKQLQTSSKRSASSLVSIRSDIEKAETGVCPACDQSTAHLDTHEAYTAELKEKEQKEVTYSDELDGKVSVVEQSLADIGELPESPITFYNSMEDALQHRHNVDTITEQLEERKEETNPYTDQVVTLRETGLEEVSYDTINDFTRLKDHQDFLYKLLTSKDSFIRKRIIDQNLQYLNYRLNHYLEKLGLPHDVRFNSDLSVDITEYGRDLDFDNLSRGERNRLILGMSWAFRDIYESLNQPMNLMCIDELVDSGMDTTGVEAALGVLKKMGRESKKNVFLISHKEELQGRVSNVLYVIKEGGFTSYANDIEILDN
ncbi:AAA family ATPase [bacterium]|nr:AAA family ATPase [Hellea sp.]MDA7807181.1 AAA family ATPase [bacterium]MDA9048010.1 AAA family ATPase [Hellea sp.]MDA9225104.1 AAA family ATPase [bacterium]